MQGRRRGGGGKVAPMDSVSVTPTMAHRTSMPDGARHKPRRPDGGPSGSNGPVEAQRRTTRQQEETGDPWQQRVLEYIESPSAGDHPQMLEAIVKSVKAERLRVTEQPAGRLGINEEEEEGAGEGGQRGKLSCDCGRYCRLETARLQRRGKAGSSRNAGGSSQAVSSPAADSGDGVDEVHVGRCDMAGCGREIKVGERVLECLHCASTGQHPRMPWRACERCIEGVEGVEEVRRPCPLHKHRDLKEMHGEQLVLARQTERCDHWTERCDRCPEGEPCQNPVLWHCGEEKCGFYLCDDCHKYTRDFESAQRYFLNHLEMCPAQHDFMVQEPGNVQICDGNESCQHGNEPVRDGVFGCTKCSFFLCESCFADESKREKAIRAIKDDRDADLDGTDDSSSGSDDDGDGGGGYYDPDHEHEEWLQKKFVQQRRAKAKQGRKAANGAGTVKHLGGRKGSVWNLAPGGGDGECGGAILSYQDSTEELFKVVDIEDGADEYSVTVELDNSVVQERELCLRGLFAFTREGFNKGDFPFFEIEIVGETTFFAGNAVACKSHGVSPNPVCDANNCPDFMEEAHLGQTIGIGMARLKRRVADELALQGLWDKRGRATICEQNRKLTMWNQKRTELYAPRIVKSSNTDNQKLPKQQRKLRVHQRMRTVGGRHYPDSYGYYSNGRVAAKGNSNAFFFERDFGGDAAAAAGAKDHQHVPVGYEDCKIHGSTCLANHDRALQRVKDVRAGTYSLCPKELKKANFLSDRPKDLATDGFWRTEKTEKQPIVGCGMNIRNQEIFFTKNNKYVGTATYHACGRPPLHFREDLKTGEDNDDPAEFCPIVSFRNVAKAKVILRWKPQMLDADMANPEAEAKKVEWEFPFSASMFKCKAASLDPISLREQAVCRLPFTSEHRSLIELMHIKHGPREACNGRDMGMDSHHIIDVYVDAQVRLHNMNYRLGDIVDRPDFNHLGHLRFKKRMMPKGLSAAQKKEELEKLERTKTYPQDYEDTGVICRVPPPGGHGTCIADAFCESFVVFVRHKQSEDERKMLQPGQLDGMFVEVHQRKVVLKDKADAEAREKHDVGARFVRSLDHVIRYSHNSISLALASAYACKNTALDSTIAREQSRLLLAQAEKFSEVAITLVDDIYKSERMGSLSPRCIDDLERHPEQRSSEAAIELALALHDLPFTHHRTAEDFTHSMWTGEYDALMLKLKPITAGDVTQWEQLEEKVKTNVRALSDIDLILSPAVRFVTAFAFFVGLLTSHHIIVFEQPVAAMYGRLSDEEIVFVWISVGFLLGECEEIVEALTKGALSKYIRDGWNLLDWSIHIIFMVYISVRVYGISAYTDGTYTAAQAHTSVRDSYRALSLNCVSLWLRLMNVMTISPRLGPLIRMITLMLKDVARFLILLFMYIFGFAGVFHVWFSKTVGDDAADVEDLRVSIIESLNGTAVPETELESAGFQTFYLSVLTLFSASMGDFSFSEIYKEQPFFGPMLLMGYLFVGAVMLLNLLIAILASVYEEVQSQAKAEHSYAKAKTVSVYGIFWDTKKTWIALPPPLNLITLPLKLFMGVCWLALKFENLFYKDAVGTPKDAVGEAQAAAKRAATVKICCFELTVAGTAPSAANTNFGMSVDGTKDDGAPQKKTVTFFGQISLLLHFAHAQSVLWLSFTNACVYIFFISLASSTFVCIYLLLVYALLLPRAVIGGIQEEVTLRYDHLLDASARAVILLPFQFILGIVNRIVQIALVSVLVCVQGTIAIPYYAFIAGRSSLSEVCDSYHLDKPNLSERLAIKSKQGKNEDETMNTRQPPESKDTYWLRLRDRLRVEEASQRRADTTKYSTGPSRNSKWFGVLEEWRFLKMLQHKEMEKDGQECADTRYKHALRVNSKGKIIISEVALLAHPLAVIEVMAELESTKRSEEKCAECDDRQPKCRRMHPQPWGANGAMKSGATRRRCTPQRNFVRKIFKQFVVEIDVEETNAQKPQQMLFFLFEDLAMYMAFRFPHPLAISPNAVCQLALQPAVQDVINADLAEKKEAEQAKREQAKVFSEMHSYIADEGRRRRIPAVAAKQGWERLGIPHVRKQRVKELVAERDAERERNGSSANDDASDSDSDIGDMV